MVKSDAELLGLSGSTLESIRQRAQDILSQLSTEMETQSAPNPKKQSKRRGQTRSSNDASLMPRLFTAYETADDILSQCAIAHLIKNGYKLSETEEDSEKFAHRIHRKQKEIKRIETQLQARLPKGRDLTGDVLLEASAIAIQQIPETVIEAREWQAKLLSRPASLPYPIIYGSSTDVRWSKTANDIIDVSFNGIDK